MHRYIAWLLAIFSLAIIAAGYSLARGWIVDIYLISSIHRILEIFFIGFLILHVAITLVHFKLTWRRLLDGVRNKKGTSIHLLRLVQRVSAWLIVIFAFLEFRDYCFSAGDALFRAADYPADDNIADDVFHDIHGLKKGCAAYNQRP